MVRTAWYGRALCIFGMLCALVPAFLMREFTVDDAFISLRYAQHLAAGEGWRFNVHGAVTDGVTPLPWVPILALFVRGDLVAGLARAQLFGIASWTVAGGALGHALRRASPVVACMGLVVAALAFPIGAWSASGMETGVATALVTLAACNGSLPGAALGGLAAAFRPELVMWSLVQATRRERVAVRWLLAAGPFAVCVAVRLVVFGSPAPLALSAKPSDLAHGLVYGGAAFLVVLTPILTVDPRALRRPLARAARAHRVGGVAGGGVWMGDARLMVPIAPSLVVVFAETARSRLSVTLRFAVAAVAGLFFLRAAPAGRHVITDRVALVERARPLLAGSRKVAALDIGWVGAATDADIVDLAGLTDPQIAYLPGGHTSKRVDVGMLLDRGVDTIVLYSPPRQVEARLAASELFESHFEAVSTAPLGLYGAYTFYRRR